MEDKENHGPPTVTGSLVAGSLSSGTVLLGGQQLYGVIGTQGSNNNTHGTQSKTELRGNLLYETAAHNNNAFRNVVSSGLLTSHVAGTAVEAAAVNQRMPLRESSTLTLSSNRINSSLQQED